MPETREDREDRGDAACRWLFRLVAEQVAPEVFWWEGTGPVVDPPFAGFIAALNRWIETGTPADYQAVLDAARVVERAWRRAAALYRIKGAGKGA